VNHHVLGVGLRAHGLDRFLDQRIQAHALKAPTDVAGFQPGQFEEVVYQARQGGDVGAHLFEVSVSRGVVDDGIVHGGDEQLERGDRRAQVVRYGCHEIALCAFGGVQLGDRGVDCATELGQLIT
jgi:hypothetical protein